MIVIPLRSGLIYWQVGSDLFPLLGAEPAFRSLGLISFTTFESKIVN